VGKYGNSGRMSRSTATFVGGTKGREDADYILGGDVLLRSTCAGRERSVSSLDKAAQNASRCPEGGPGARLPKDGQAPGSTVPSP